MIRNATFADLASIVGIILAADRQMDFSGRYGCGVNIPRIVRVVANAIECPGADMSVVDLDGTVAGACLVELVPFMWDDATLIAQELLWHIRQNFHPAPPPC